MAGTTQSENQVQRVEVIGAGVLRYGLVLVLLWVGCLKFTAYEAANIQKLVPTSPFLSWLNNLMSHQNFSMLIGTIEIVAGLLIASRPFWPKLSVVGSIMAIGTFLITLSFLLTTPGVWEPGYGFPSLSGNPGQFLAKDIVLLGAAIWTAGEALRAAQFRSQVGS